MDKRRAIRHARDGSVYGSEPPAVDWGKGQVQTGEERAEKRRIAKDESPAM